LPSKQIQRDIEVNYIPALQKHFTRPVYKYDRAFCKDQAENNEKQYIVLFHFDTVVSNTFLLGEMPSMPSD